MMQNKQIEPDQQNSPGQRYIRKYLTISLGVAQLTGEEDVNSLISRVDEALYGAKDKGRNCVNFLKKK